MDDFYEYLKGDLINFLMVVRLSLAPREKIFDNLVEKMVKSEMSIHCRASPERAPSTKIIMLWS